MNKNHTIFTLALILSVAAPAMAMESGFGAFAFGGITNPIDGVSADVLSTVDILGSVDHEDESLDMRGAPLVHDEESVKEVPSVITTEEPKENDATAKAFESEVKESPERTITVMEYVVAANPEVAVASQESIVGQAPATAERVPVEQSAPQSATSRTERVAKFFEPAIGVAKKVPDYYTAKYLAQDGGPRVWTKDCLRAHKRDVIVTVVVCAATIAAIGGIVFGLTKLFKKSPVVEARAKEDGSVESKKQQFKRPHPEASNFQI